MCAGRPEELAITRLLRFESARALETMACELALFARPGLAILLRGELGSGKSTFARAFIRALAEDPELEVPSPSFTLVQTYDDLRVPVAHADLYRVGSSCEIAELGLDHLLDDHLLIVEWPERLAEAELEKARVLDIELRGQGDWREAKLTANGVWARAAARNEAIRGFLAPTPWRNAQRSFFEGDASFRRYETLAGAGESKLLMDMPARPDGPPVKDGLPYSAIAHLAEDIRAVVAVNGELARRGYSAAAVEHCDLEQGLAVIEHLGHRVFGRMVLEGCTMQEPMQAATEVLAAMAEQRWPATVALPDSSRYHVPSYDLGALMIEVDLLPGWFWALVRNDEIEPAARGEFEELWRQALPVSLEGPRVWTLRDYHSPNLLWLPERQGLRRVGIIDTQDCLLGHPAYDLASLLQDARVDLPGDLTDHLYGHYCALRGRSESFDRDRFDEAFAVLGAQRATKILGIFARLSKRDGKHGYLRHIPRVSHYLERNLTHPALAPLRRWFDRHLPAGRRERP